MSDRDKLEKENDQLRAEVRRLRFGWDLLNEQDDTIDELRAEVRKWQASAAHWDDKHNTVRTELEATKAREKVLREALEVLHDGVNRQGVYTGMTWGDAGIIIREALKKEDNDE